ncbi:hypothetical protein T484DRAFT_1860960 [Baffinella frigidus]|nr:hypothetical protein T484DRAFT_1860960 [Cryptophyta sp. CCMP2293]
MQLRVSQNERQRTEKILCDLLPRHIAKEMAAAPGCLPCESKIAVVLQLDLVGFTVLQLDRVGFTVPPIT